MGDLRENDMNLIKIWKKIIKLKNLLKIQNVIVLTNVL